MNVMYLFFVFDVQQQATTSKVPLAGIFLCVIASRLIRMPLLLRRHVKLYYGCIEAADPRGTCILRSECQLYCA